MLQLFGLLEDRSEEIRREEERDARMAQAAMREEEKRVAEAAQLKREQRWTQTRMNDILMSLFNDGYSAQQITEAILLGECAVTWSDNYEPTWHLTHPSGRVLRPVHQPITLSDGPYGPSVDGRPYRLRPR